MDVFDIPIIGENKTERVSGEAPRAASSPFTLHDLAGEWAFFNHGALFAFAGFEDPHKDPVGDWFNSIHPQPEYLKQAFERKVFEGLDVPAYLGPRSRETTWNHVICGIRKDYWPHLLEYVAGVVAHDPRQRRYYQIFYGELQVLDPGYVERYSLVQPDLPRIPVTVFCVDGSHRRWEFQLPVNPLAPPAIIELPPRPEVKRIAEALDRGDTQPLTERVNPAHDPFVRHYQEVLRKGPVVGPSVGQDVKELFRGNRHQSPGSD